MVTCVAAYETILRTFYRPKKKKRETSIAHKQ